MKPLTSLALIISALFLAGCETEPTIGMTEKQWLLHAVLADPVYAEGSETVYRSNREYYTFRDGLLVKIDKTWFPPQKTEDLSRSPQMTAPTAPTASTAPTAPSDVYTELRKLDALRKDGIITEEEFQVQKKKILDHKE